MSTKKEWKTALQPIQWAEVKSSNIKRVGLQEGLKPDTRCQLWVEFHNDSVYVYRFITKETFQELIKAESVGSYFHQNIRTNKDIKTIRY